MANLKITLENLENLSTNEKMLHRLAELYLPPKFRYDFTKQQHVFYTLHENVKIQLGDRLVERAGYSLKLVQTYTIGYGDILVGIFEKRDHFHPNLVLTETFDIVCYSNKIEDFRIERHIPKYLRTGTI